MVYVLNLRKTYWSVLGDISLFHRTTRKNICMSKLDTFAEKWIYNVKRIVAGFNKIFILTKINRNRKNRKEISKMS